MSEFTEDMFDENKIKKAIKKGKKKSLFTIITVSIIVFVVLNILNFAISVYFSQKAYKQWDAYVRLTNPNGYISETLDSWGLLGGMSHYKINKDMKIKSVVVEQKQYQFGLIPSILISRGQGGGYGVTSENWQLTYKENGWREMLFFHPQIDYKKYADDEELIDRMEGDKIYEVALSFDKAYKPSELFFIQLPEMSWYWVDTYSDSQLKTWQQEAKENDWSATFIQENDALGFSIRDPYSNFEGEYNEFLELLKNSYHNDHNKTYEMMKDRNDEDLEVLGVVIYGTKDEIEELIKNPIVKAVSLGGVIDNY